LKEETLHRTVWRTRFERCYGPIARQATWLILLLLLLLLLLGLLLYFIYIH